MGFETTGRLPNGWEWREIGSDRIELGRSGGPRLLGERSNRDGGWWFVYRVQRGESVRVDMLGESSQYGDPRAILASAARYIEDHDSPEEHLGELLVVEDDAIRCREWRIE